MTNRLQLLLVFTLLAAISVAALSVVLITGAVRSAESVVVADTHRVLDLSNAELGQQLESRVSSDSAWPGLPLAAQDISLRGISQTVLRSYPGVEGGFFFRTGANNALVGYSYPTHDSGLLKTDVPVAERADILAAAGEAMRVGSSFRLIRGARDLVAIGAQRRGTAVAWSMKRLTGFNDPGTRRRAWMLAGLVIAALISVAGTLGTVVVLRTGIAQIQNGLRVLKSDFAYRLPARKDELGEISLSINEMAETRRRLERELRREDRLKTVGRLTANLAHEIRNPLNSIRLSMQSLEQRLARNAARREDLTLVIAEVDRLNALLTQLLAFGKNQAPSMLRQELCPVVWQGVQLMTPEASVRGISIAFTATDPAVAVTFDADQLTQAVTNLVLNALQASASGQSIRVNVASGDRVCIEVSDSGPGVSDEQRERLFEPFFTTRSLGTGLGLAVSRELIQGMGGQLYLRENGPGATFVIELPYDEDKHGA